MLEIKHAADLAKMWRDYSLEAAKRGLSAEEACAFADRMLLEWQSRFNKAGFCVKASIVNPFADLVGMVGQVCVGDGVVSGQIISIHSPSGDARQKQWLVDIEGQDQLFQMDDVLVKFPA
jgi:hypothetical protein